MKQDETPYCNIKVEECADSEIEVKGEIPENIISQYRKKVVTKLSKNANIPGFRKGHIPEHILLKNIGEQTILEEAAEMALGDMYPKVVEEKKLHVIGRPHVTITKLASGNPVGFTIRTAIMPIIVLPDYKKIAGEIMNKESEARDEEVTDKELDEAMLNIRKQRASVSKDPKTEIRDEDLPELTDDFVKTLGDFKTVDDFKKTLKENMKREKKMRAQEKKRVSVGNKIIEESKFSIPKILIESELDKMLAQFKGDVKKMGIEFSEHLAKIKKSEEDLRKEWKVDAEKRARLQLILNLIARKEIITADKEIVDNEVSNLLEHFKEADPEGVHIYVETMLTNEKVFKFLEKQK